MSSIARSEIVSGFSDSTVESRDDVVLFVGAEDDGTEEGDENEGLAAAEVREGVGGVVGDLPEGAGEGGGDVVVVGEDLSEDGALAEDAEDLDGVERVDDAVLVGEGGEGCAAGAGGPLRR